MIVVANVRNCNMHSLVFADSLRLFLLTCIQLFIQKFISKAQPFTSNADTFTPSSTFILEMVKRREEKPGKQD